MNKINLILILGLLISYIVGGVAIYILQKEITQTNQTISGFVTTWTSRFTQEMQAVQNTNGIINNYLTSQGIATTT
jgi:hypothetical protein